MKNIVCVLAGLAITLPVAVQAQSAGPQSASSPLSSPIPPDALWTLSAGAQVTSGEYGSSRSTTMVSVPLGVRWSTGSLSLAATVPYVSIRSAGVAFAAFDGTPLVMLPDRGGRKRTYSDLGDLTLSASYDFTLPSDVVLRATGRLKIPVQGRSAVSTGRLDWSLGGEASKTFGVVTPFASVSYRHFGNVRDWDIRDGIAASAGASAAFGPGALAVSYEYARSASRYLRDDHEIVAVYDMPLGSRFRIAPYANVGLSSGAPDAGGGLRLSVSL